MSKYQNRTNLLYMKDKTHKMACLLPKICMLRYPWLAMLITEPTLEKMSKYIFNYLDF